MKSPQSPWRRIPGLEPLEPRLTPAAHDTLATAVPLTFDANQQAQASAALADPQQVDLYQLTLAAGDEATVAVAAYTPANPLDSGLRVFDDGGLQLASDDNHGGPDPEVTFTAPDAGFYYVGVSSAGDFGYDPRTAGSGAGGESTGTYTLSAARSPAAETGANHTLAAADVINGNARVSGTLAAGLGDYFRFTVTATGRLTATVAPADPTALLPRLALYGGAGQLLIQSDATGAAPARLLQHLQPGTYYLIVSAVPGTGMPLGSHDYVLGTTFDAAQPAFEDVSAGRDPAAVAVGDFNHDGRLDFVTADAGGNEVSVLLGLGDGSFAPAVSYPVGDSPDAVVVGDFNGDGNLDVAVTNSDDVTVSVLLGRGDGTFLPAVTYAVGDFPDAIAVGDFDGHPDLVVADYDDHSLSFLSGRGDGTFRPAVTLPADSGPDGLAVADVNGDGRPDIIVANDNTDTVSVLLGQGGGAFLPAPSVETGLAPFALVVADLNGDGKPDVATANYVDGTVSVLLGRGDGDFTLAATYAVGTGTNALAVGDFDHDGRPDLAATNFQDNTVVVLRNRGAGNFVLDTDATPGTPLCVAVGDFDGDGNPDLIEGNGFGGGTAALFRGAGDGTFLRPASFQVGSLPDSVAAGDFNHDGNTDLVVANFNTGSLSILPGRGDGTFRPATTYDLPDSPEGVVVGDFNGDGSLDIATANSSEHGTVSVLLGRGDGTFLPAVSYPVGEFPDAIAVGDVNGDGIPDLAVANSYGALGNDVSVLLGRGDGTFRPATTYPVGQDPYAVAVGHFGHGGAPDIVTANANDNTVSVLRGRGDGTFLPAVAYPVDKEPESVAVGDFNHDGLPDVVTANVTNETVSVLPGRIDGTFSPAETFATGAVGPLVVGDFNDDGNLDLALSSGDDHQLSLWLGRGDGTFVPGAVLPVGDTPEALAVADLNGDGQLDLAIAGAGKDLAIPLLGRGNGQFQAATPENGVTPLPVPYLRDFDGDGIPDSVILDSSGNILFRSGLPGGSDQFAPPVVINPHDPARDVTPFRTAAGWGVAAVDAAGDTASIYSWSAAAASFERSAAFATGSLPVRIAAADLTGDGLDDLVVANDFDDSVTVALQEFSGRFGAPVTRPVGAAPSDVTFADVGGPDGPAIVVSDQASGDFSVLFNDPAHSFARQSRYRAGDGPFDIETDSGEAAVLSELGTVGVVAGEFTGPGSSDLLAVNRGSKSFVLLRDLGQGRFSVPQPGDSYPTGDEPGQVVSLTLPGDAAPSVAILMEDLGQVWLYRNNGDGTFAPPTAIGAGNDPRGFSVATVGGRLALLVGNDFGDILTLLYDGHGGFAPDRTSLQDVPLAVGTVPGTGRQYAIVADPQLDRVAIYYRIPGTNRFDSPVPITSGTVPLLAPGAVQLFSVPGQPDPYLVVADSLSNDVLVYRGQAGGQFGAPTAYAVGFDPVAIAVGDINKDGVPDLAVANSGSNDVSVLIGALDPATGAWTATPYQRLSSRGSGPTGVAFLDAGAAGGPSLVVTNGDGTVATLPGIGSGGKGSGFFQANGVSAVNLGGARLQPFVATLVSSSTGPLPIGTGAGSAFVTQLFDLRLTALDEVGDLFVAGFADGSVGLVSAAGALLATEPTGFSEPLSALRVLQDGDNLDVFVTARGSDAPALVTFALVPALTDLPRSAPVAQGTGLAGAELLVVATLLSGGPSEPRPAAAPEVAPVAETFALFVPPSAGAESAAAGGGGAAVEENPAPAPAPGWEAYPLGVGEALDQRVRRQEAEQRAGEVIDALRGVPHELRHWFGAPAAPPMSAPEATPPAAEETSERSAPPAERQSGAAELGADVSLDRAGPTRRTTDVRRVCDLTAGAVVVLLGCVARIAGHGGPRRERNEGKKARRVAALDRSCGAEGLEL